MYCPNCGKMNPDNSNFCMSCGYNIANVKSTISLETDTAEPVSILPPESPAAAAQPSAASFKTKKEFLILPENKSIRRGVCAAGIICYICAGITLFLAFFGSVSLLIDVVIVMVLGLLIHLRSSRAAAIILTVYSALNVIITTIAAGTFGGYLPLIAGILGIIYTFKAENTWKVYQETNRL